MARSPRWKVYDGRGNYIGCTKDPTDAAALASLYPDGGNVRRGHQKRWTVWTEGVDGHAGASYDAAAETIMQRADELRPKV